ncbi:hypothetical protein [Eubacterium sp.]
MRFICILSILGLLFCSAIELVGGGTPYLVTIQGILIFMAGGSFVLYQLFGRGKNSENSKNNEDKKDK